jgi:hypothetical protein
MMYDLPPLVAWPIVIAGTVGTIYTIVASIYWLLRPGETAPNHPKRMILRSDR